MPQKAGNTTHTPSLNTLPRAIAQTPLRATPADLLHDQHLIQTSSMAAMVAEQTLAAQRSADGVFDERALSLPTDWASERLHVAELALRPALGVQGQGLATGTAGERDAGRAGGKEELELHCSNPVCTGQYGRPQLKE